MALKAQLKDLKIVAKQANRANKKKVVNLKPNKETNLVQKASKSRSQKEPNSPD